MSLDTSTSNNSFIQTSRVVSQAATAVMKTCFESQGFHAAIVPSRNPESFGIKVAYRGTGNTDIVVEKISGNPPVTCDTPINTNVHNDATIICNKSAAQTVQVAMRTNKGSLPATDVLGTKDIKDDIRDEIKVLSDKVAAVGQSSCLGCIEQSVLTEAQFQNANGSDWVLCDGRSIVGSKLARLTGISNAPNLLGVFLRGRNLKRCNDVEEVELGVYEADTVGPHQHVQRIYSDRSTDPGPGAGILWDGGKRYVDKVGDLVRDADPKAETRPKNVTVNYFYRIN